MDTEGQWIVQLSWTECTPWGGVQLAGVMTTTGGQRT